MASGRCERKSSRGQRRADSADVSRLDRNSRASLAKARGELLRILQITFDGAEDVIGLGKQRFGSRYRGGQHLELGQRGRLRKSNTTTNSNTPHTQPPPQLPAATTAAAAVAGPDTRAAIEAATAAAQAAQTAAAVATPTPTPVQISNSFDPLA